MGPGPTVTHYLVTEKIRHSSAKVFILIPTRTSSSHAYPPLQCHSASPLHNLAALAQECRNIQVFLLEVRHHRVTHRIERNHFRRGMTHRDWHDSAILGSSTIKSGGGNDDTAGCDRPTGSGKSMASSWDAANELRTSAPRICRARLASPKPVAITVIFTASFIFSSITAPKIMLASSCAAA